MSTGVSGSPLNSGQCLEPQGRHLDVSVDVEAVVLAGQDHAAVIHQRHVKTLSMLHLALKSRNKLAVLAEHGQVEVVVVVGYGDFTRRVNADTDRVVGDPFASDLPQEVAVIVEHLNAVSSVVADEDLLPVIDHNAVGELQVLGAAKLVEDVSHLIKNNDTHDLALDNNDPPLVVHADAAGMLENVRAKLPDKLSVLVVDLNLMRGRPLRDDDVPTGLDHSHPVGVEQLTVPLANLSKLEFEPPLLVKYLDPVVVGVRHNDVILSIDGHSTGLRELALKNSKFTKLAVVDHLLAFDLRLERVETRVDRAVGNGRPRRHGRRLETGLGHELTGELQQRVSGVLLAQAQSVLEALWAGGSWSGQIPKQRVRAIGPLLIGVTQARGGGQISDGGAREERGQLRG